MHTLAMRRKEHNISCHKVLNIFIESGVTVCLPQHVCVCVCARECDDSLAAKDPSKRKSHKDVSPSNRWHHINKERHQSSTVTIEHRAVNGDELNGGCHHSDSLVTRTYSLSFHWPSLSQTVRVGHRRPLVSHGIVKSVPSRLASINSAVSNSIGSLGWCRTNASTGEHV